MKRFKSRKEIFAYITRKFLDIRTVILIRGSSVNKPLRSFSDIDIEIYGKKQKPYYEIIFLNNKPILISIYFYEFIEGKRVRAPSPIKVLYGQFNNKIKPEFSRDTYNPKEKIKRECQLVVDFMFKYLRSKNKKYLEMIQESMQ